MSAVAPFGIAVPFYRDVGLLSAMLTTIVGQTDTNWRCVVVDDCSPDPGAAAAVAALGDSRIVYQRNDERLGIAGNFDRCFAALGEHPGLQFVAIVHGDDLLMPNFVSEMRAAHQCHPQAAAIVGQATVVGLDGNSAISLADTIKRLMWRRRHEVQTLVGERGLSRLLAGLFWYCPAMSYRYDSLPATRWDSRWQQVMDLDLFGRMLLSGQEIVLWPREVYLYRRHSGTSTAEHTDSLVRFREEAAASNELADAAAIRGWTRAARTGRRRWMSRAHCLLVMLRQVLRGDFAMAREAAVLAVSAARSAE